MIRSIIVFIIGFMCGALLLDLLCMNAIKVHKTLIRYNLYGEQELLARRSERENNYIRALVHRWNTADILSQDGFRVLRPELAKGFGCGVLFPFQAIALSHMKKTMEPGEKEIRFNEGFQRAQLALTMEKVGMVEAAEEQWNNASELSSTGIDELRKMVLRLRERADSEQSMEGERAVLGD